MNGRNTGASGVEAVIGWVLGVSLLSGCIASQDPEDAINGNAATVAPASAARMGEIAAAKRCAPGSGPNEGAGGQVLLTEEWNSFDPEIWNGDGDQWVARGLFTAGEGAFSAAADWRPSAGIRLSEGQTLLFADELVTDPDVPMDTSARAAEFFVSGDSLESYTNYLTVDVRYFPIEGMATIESYGQSGDAEFDRVVEMPWNRAAGRLKLEVAVSAKRYEIRLDGRIADQIALSRALTGIYLLEVGVQKGTEGAFGLIDRTVISVQSSQIRNPGRGQIRCPHRDAGPTEKRGRKLRARERMSRCMHPSYALKAAARFGR